MAKVYLAMYKHKRDWRKEPVKAMADRITRFFTKGKYSHCEIAVEHIEFTNGHHYEHQMAFDCYSSSVQDGGVRCKQIDVSDNTKWDLIPLTDVTEAQIKLILTALLARLMTGGGALGTVLGIKQKRSKYFCSEWCLMQFRVARVVGGLARINQGQCLNMMTKDKPIINFNWKFGDDESETLTLDEKEVPEGFADSEFDLFIVPDSKDPVIHLTKGNGIALSDNNIKITCTRDRLANTKWKTASWALKNHEYEQLARHAMWRKDYALQLLPAERVEE